MKNLKARAAKAYNDCQGDRMAKVAAAAAVLGLSVSQAHAALDAAVTGAITTAQTDLLALFSALTAAGVVIWVGKMIYNKFRVK